MGIFNFLFKGKKITFNQKVLYTANGIKSRMKKYGAVDPETGVRSNYKNIELDEILRLSDEVIMGFPEGSITTILETYWYLKLREGYSESDIYKEIEIERENVGFPSGMDSNFSSINDFIIYRLRLEEPIGWSEDNISDEEIEFSIKNISKPCKEYFSN